MGAGASGEEALDAGMWGVRESAMNTAAAAATDPAGEEAGETDAAAGAKAMEEVGEVKEGAAVTGGEDGEGGGSAVGDGGVTEPVESMDTVEGEEKEASAVAGDAASEEGAASSS